MVGDIPNRRHVLGIIILVLRRFGVNTARTLSRIVEREESFCPLFACAGLLTLEKRGICPLLGLALALGFWH
jgi:hypothetical protein